MKFKDTSAKLSDLNLPDVSMYPYRLPFEADSWRKKDGTTVKVSSMADSHVANCIREIKAKGLEHIKTLTMPQSEIIERDGIMAKVVVDDISDEDDEGNKRSTSLETTSNMFWLRHTKNVSEDEDVDESKDKESVMLPIHPFVKCFHLEQHVHYLVHVDNLHDYEWDTGLSEKLVMSQEKKDLIGLLVSSAGEVLEDIVKGKTGGIIVAATGVPGTGKTLTAEVYSETVKRALYVVQCSQLGTYEESVEKRLALVLSRATRWKAILLIDECDVYVRARGTDIQQNAIVGVFLRTLERYRGILFLTTNRVTEIDDAIVSRLTAHVWYDVPRELELREIWTILGNNYGVEVSAKLAADLATEFKGVSGRSVKNMLKLARIVMKKEQCVASVKLFKRLAQFQDLEHKYVE